MDDARLVVHQSKYEIRTFLRDPTATFFTLALPVVFLVLFVTIFGSETLDSGVTTSTYYVPGIVALAVVSATFVNLSITLTQQRASGILKRVRGTPLPPWVFLAGRLVTAVALGVVMAVVLVWRSVGWSTGSPSRVPPWSASSSPSSSGPPPSAPSASPSRP